MKVRLLIPNPNNMSKTETPLKVAQFKEQLSSLLTQASKEGVYIFGTAIFAVKKDDKRFAESFVMDLSNKFNQKKHVEKRNG